MEYVSYEEFKKLDMRVGTIREVTPVEGADKLLKCMIDFGLKSTSKEVGSPDHLAEQDGLEERDIRQIVSGIREFFPEFEKLVGKQVLYIVNLEPRTIRGVQSNGMLMAVDGLDGKPVFLTPEVSVASGARVR